MIHHILKSKILALCSIAIIFSSFQTVSLAFAGIENVTISVVDGNQLIIEKNFTELLELTNSIIEKNPTDFNALFYKGRALLGLERYSEAVTTFETILKEHEIVTNHVLFYYAESLLKTEKYDLAIQYFNYIPETDDFYPDALLEKGTAFNRMGNFTQALTAFNKVLTLNPESIQAQINKANTLSQMNKHEEALSIIDQVLVNHPDSVSAIINKGIILKNDHKLVKALEVLDVAIQLDKNNLTALNEKALILADLERYDESLEIYDSLLKNYPSDTKLLINKGTVLIKSNQGANALELFNKVLQISPDDTDALLNRGAYFYTIGNNEKALEDFNQILSIKPTHLNALKNKYLTLGKLEKHEEALSVIENILKITPNDEVVLKDRDIAISYIINEKNTQNQYVIVFMIIVSFAGSALFVIRSLRKEKTESKRELSKKTYVIVAFPIWIIITVLILLYLDLRPDFDIFDKSGDFSNKAAIVLEIGFSVSISVAIFLYSIIDQSKMSELIANTNSIINRQAEEKTARIQDFLRKGRFALLVLDFGCFRRDMLLNSHNDDYRNRSKIAINFELNENTTIKLSVDELYLIRESGLFPEKIDKVLAGICREAQKHPFLNEINHLEYPSNVSYSKLHTMIQSAQKEFDQFQRELNIHTS